MENDQADAIREGNVHFPCSADCEQDQQPYPVDPFSATSIICGDHTYRGEPDSALSGGYAPDSAKAEGSSIVDVPGEG